MSMLRDRARLMQDSTKDGGMRSGTGDRGGPRRSQLGGQGKNQIVVIDQELAQRWNVGKLQIVFFEVGERGRS